METLFNKVFRRLQEVEDRYGIIIKVEMFTDLTGSVMFITDTRQVDWKLGFYFSGFEMCSTELDKFEEYLGG